MIDGRFRLELWEKALARWREEERWDEHHSRVAISLGGEQSSLEALAPSNPGHQQRLQDVPSDQYQLGSPNLDKLFISNS